MYWRKSAEDPPTTTAPWDTRVSRTSGAVSALFTSAFRRAMISGGVLAGANRPFHDSASKPGKPDSANVGTLGSWGRRLTEATAMGRGLPLLRCGNADIDVMNTMST